MAIKIDTSKPAMENCCRFSFCEINKCPLSPDYSKLKNDSSDPAFRNKKQRCINKKRRIAIAKFYPELKNKGMTPKEQKATARWNNLSESDKQEQINKMMKKSPISQLLGSGHTIIPPKRNQSQNPYTKQEKTPTTPPHLIKSTSKKEVENDA